MNEHDKIEGQLHENEASKKSESQVRELSVEGQESATQIYKDGQKVLKDTKNRKAGPSTDNFGRGHFQEGAIVFTAPGQLSAPESGESHFAHRKQLIAEKITSKLEANPQNEIENENLQNQQEQNILTELLKKYPEINCKNVVEFDKFIDQLESQIEKQHTRQSTIKADLSANLKDAKAPVAQHNFISGLAPEQQAKLFQEAKEFNQIAEATPLFETRIVQARAQGHMADNLTKLEQQLKPDDFRKVLTSIDSLLDPEQNSFAGLSLDERRTMAAQLADQLVHPEQIRQGQKGTCAATDISLLMAMGEPGNYAEQVASVVLNGELVYRNADESTHSVKVLAPSSFRLDPSNGGRTELEATMQRAFMNGLVQTDNPSNRYLDYPSMHGPMIDKPESFSKSKFSSTGEAEINADGSVSEHNVGPRNMSKLLEKLTGEHYEYKEHTHISSADKLSEALADAAKSGKPFVLQLYGIEGDSISHVIVVRNYDVKSGALELIDTSKDRATSASSNLEELNKYLRKRFSELKKLHPEEINDHEHNEMFIRVLRPKD